MKDGSLLVSNSRNAAGEDRPQNAVAVKNIQPTQSKNGLNISSVIFLSRTSTRGFGSSTKMLKKSN
jgi:hypothetical protein